MIENKLYYNVDEEGFTFWMNGFIVLDAPFNRMELEPEIRKTVIEMIHKCLMEG